MELDSSELLKRFVAAGMGIGFAPKSTVAADEQAGVLKILPIESVRLHTRARPRLPQRQVAQPRRPVVHRDRHRTAPADSELNLAAQEPYRIAARAICEN